MPEISGSSTNRFARRIEQPDLSHGDLTAKADCDVRPGPPGTALVIARIRGHACLDAIVQWQR